jgi:hypothetical protein
MLAVFVSEKLYWIILITVFTTVALIVWSYLFPNGVIDANLAANLFTSSIFMVLTVVFLSWLLNVREKSDWKIVEERVTEILSWHLKNILSETISLLKLPDELSAISTKDPWEKAYAECLLARVVYIRK